MRLLTFNKHYTEADFNKNLFTWEVKDLAIKEAVDLIDRDPLAMKHPTTTIHMPNIGAPRYRNKLASEVLDTIPEMPPSIDSAQNAIRDRGRNSVIQLPSEPMSAGTKPSAKMEVQLSRFKMAADEARNESNAQSFDLTKMKLPEDRTKSILAEKPSKDTDKLQDYLFMSQPVPQSLNTSITSPNALAKEFVSKKLNWHVDTAALVKKAEFKSIANMLISKYHLDKSDYETVRHHLLHLATYFESFVQKLFVDSKSCFFETEFIKAVFSEELNLKRGKEARSFHDSRRGEDSAANTSVSFGVSPDPPEEIVFQAQVQRSQGRVCCFSTSESDLSKEPYRQIGELDQSVNGPSFSLSSRSVERTGGDQDLDEEHSKKELDTTTDELEPASYLHCACCG